MFSKTYYFNYFLEKKKLITQISNEEKYLIIGKLSTEISCIEIWNSKLLFLAVKIEALQKEKARVTFHHNNQFFVLP